MSLGPTVIKCPNCKDEVLYKTAYRLGRMGFCSKRCAEEWGTPEMRSRLRQSSWGGGRL